MVSQLIMTSYQHLGQNALFNIGLGAAGVLTVVSIFLIRGVIKNSASQVSKRSSRRKKEARYIHMNDDILSRFSKAIQCQTISYSKHGSEGPSCADELLKLHSVIKDCKYTVFWR